MLKDLDEANARHLLHQEPAVKNIIGEAELKIMEINGADLANKNLDDTFMKKYWRIKDKMKRKILLDYIKKNSPKANLKVYTSLPLEELNHE